MYIVKGFQTVQDDDIDDNGVRCHWHFILQVNIHVFIKLIFLFYTTLITAAFGGLDLHGAPRGDSWTQLNQTANAGDTQLTVQSPVDWVAGDVIILAPTSYSTWEAEKLTISAVSADRMTLTFTPALQFKHIGKCAYSCIYIKSNIFWLQLTLELSIKCCIFQNYSSSNIKLC